MIDLRRLRDDLEGLVSNLSRKGVARETVVEAAELDAAWRALQVEADELRRRSNEGSKAIGQAPADQRASLLAEMKEVKEGLGEVEQRLAEAEEAARTALARLPNPPHPSVPAGGEDDYEVVKVVGEAAPLPEGYLAHDQIGERLGMWDGARGAKVSGSRFVYLTGPGVLLEQALVGFALEVVLAHGYRPMVPPVLVRADAMYGTGFFPAERSEYYEVDGGDLFLVGTSEVPLAAFHRDEIVDDLPLRYCGLSSCFRREAGTYGKDTAGIFRVHQFTKLEMFSYVAPDEGEAEHERILSIEEEIVSALRLPYRVVNVAGSDLGAPAAKKYDIEAWLPSEGRYREITSCSNCTDFQARRLNVRRRRDRGTETVHTLNGTAVTDRWMCFVVEHYQQPDGSVVVPEALRPYVPGRLEVIDP